MIAAAKLLTDLGRAGLQLRRDGDQLRVKPASRLTPEQRALILAAKVDLVALLREAHETAEALIGAINEACRLRGDDEANRLALLEESAQLDAAAQLDLLEHFRCVAQLWRGIARTDKTDEGAAP